MFHWEGESLADTEEKRRLPRVAALGLQEGDGTQCLVGLQSYTHYEGEEGRASGYTCSQLDTLQRWGIPSNSLFSQEALHFEHKLLVFISLFNIRPLEKKIQVYSLMTLTYAFK